MSNSKSTNSGAGCLGTIIAAMLSLKTWGLTWWVVLHFLLGWIYVAYWIIFLSKWF